MNSLLVKPPNILKRIYPNRIWSIPNNENKVYLTFDDGPIPQVTPWVLDILKEFQAKATFFCIGENMDRHFDICNRVIVEGHRIGNHTYNHLNGWKTTSKSYIENVKLLEDVLIVNDVKPEKKTLLFRPPFGRLSSKQSKSLQKRGYKIYMWDVLSGDFSKKLSREKCLNNVIKNTSPGSIIVFHDSLKAERNLRYVLPKALEFISEKGWECSALA